MSLFVNDPDGVGMELIVKDRVVRDPG